MHYHCFRISSMNSNSTCCDRIHFITVVSLWCIAVEAQVEHAATNRSQPPKSNDFSMTSRQQNKQRRNCSLRLGTSDRCPFPLFKCLVRAEIEIEERRGGVKKPINRCVFTMTTLDKAFPLSRTHLLQWLLMMYLLSACFHKKTRYVLWKDLG